MQCIKECAVDLDFTHVKLYSLLLAELWRTLKADS